MQSPNTCETCGYIVMISGHLSESLTNWLEGLEVTALPDGNTLIVGNDLDQASLFGLLLCIRDLGIQLVLAARRDLQLEEIGKLFLSE